MSFGKKWHDARSNKGLICPISFFGELPIGEKTFFFSSQFTRSPAVGLQSIIVPIPGNGQTEGKGKEEKVKWKEKFKRRRASCSPPR